MKRGGTLFKQEQPDPTHQGSQPSLQSCILEQEEAQSWEKRPFLGLGCKFTSQSSVPWKPHSHTHTSIHYSWQRQLLASLAWSCWGMQCGCFLFPCHQTAHKHRKTSFTSRLLKAWGNANCSAEILPFKSQCHILLRRAAKQDRHPRASGS